MSRLPVLPALAAAAFSLCGVLPASAQLRSQSSLTPEDADPTFRLTLDHLGGGPRVFGLAPRDLRWAPDGSEIYFRWNESPTPGQLPEDDPWFAADREGRTLRELTPDEVRLVPGADAVRSRDTGATAWSRDGTLFVWTAERGTRAVYSAAGSLGALRMRPDGSVLYFATEGLTPAASENGDLWEYDLASGLIRQVAEAVPAEEEDSKQQAWLEAQQTELVAVVRERKEREERREELRRMQRTAPPQRIPVPKGERITDLRLSPDGRYLAFRSRKDPAEPRRTEFMEFVNESGRATEKDARPKVGEALPSWRTGFVEVDPAARQEDIDIRWIEDGEERATVIHGPEWSPDGRWAAMQTLSMDHKSRWISLLDFETATLRHLDHQTEEAWIGGPLVEGRWRPGMLTWLPDSRGFVFGSVESGWAMLLLARPEGGEVSALTEGAFEVRRAELAPDGESFFLTTSREHPGEEHLYRLPARGGPLTRLTGGEAMHSWEVSPDGGRVALVRQSLTEFGDLHLLDAAESGAEPVRVTKSGTDAFYRTAWAGSEIVEYDLPDGTTAWARIWDTPEGAVAGETPAVVYAHGCGECAQAVVKGWSRLGSIVYANFLRQRGYAAASVDYRGSSGYGHRNRTYAYRQMGVSDIDSALPLLDRLVERSGVHPGRIGVYGGSYGGFFTLMSLFRHPGRYAAGVALYPVTDWAHYNQGYTSRILNGSQLDDEEAYRVSSPVYYADGLEDALQIQHGLVDGNVQIQDSFRLAQILIEKQKDFDLVVYPVEDHGWDEIPTRRDSYRRMTDFFDRHLTGGSEDRPPTDSSPPPGQGSKSSGALSDRSPGLEP